MVAMFSRGAVDTGVELAFPCVAATPGGMLPGGRLRPITNSSPGEAATRSPTAFRRST